MSSNVTLPDQDIDEWCLFRMLWAFARDCGVPLHSVWSALNVYTGTPVNAVWAMAALAFLLGLPMLYSLSVFSASISISSIGLYVSCKSTFEVLFQSVQSNSRVSRVSHPFATQLHPYSTLSLRSASLVKTRC